MQNLEPSLFAWSEFHRRLFQTTCVSCVGALLTGDSPILFAKILIITEFASTIIFNTFAVSDRLDRRKLHRTALIIEIASEIVNVFMMRQWNLMGNTGTVIWGVLSIWHASKRIEYIQMIQERSWFPSSSSRYV